MLEHAFRGSKTYWAWVLFLVGTIGVGVACYLWQLSTGLHITGLSREVTWGFYIAQLTFLVGVAASAVMVVLPYYLHDYKAFGKITILGEYVAIGAVVMCILFIFVDLGQPFRAMNIILHPSPKSMIFWDMLAVNGYLGLNILISHITLDAERNGVAPPKWIKPIIILSIPWAVSIHTVTAFLYCGLAARPFWMTAVLAPRFLASAFSAGPALLILLCLLMQKLTKFNVGKEPIQKLATIVTYAMLINIFLVLMEVFTALYSGIPEHASHFTFLFFGLEGNTTMVPWMWTSQLLALVALVLLLNPATRRNEKTLVVACLAVYFSLWIDKGLGMIVAGFVPTPLHNVAYYLPSVPELLISLGIYAIGALIITLLYKMVLTVRRETA